MSKKKDDSFWLGYSDLMTSMFFVFLVLFVITTVQLKNRIDATESQLEKIKEIEAATENLDSAYFEYIKEYKKHKLKISVNFKVGSADFNNISKDTQYQLKEAGHSIANLISAQAEKGVQYMVIIEGQASNLNDKYAYNYELSYNRALALKKFWENNGVIFDQMCEVLISGSGDGELSGTGLMRETNESENQRFLIHIVPKYGEILKNDNEL